MSQPRYLSDGGGTLLAKWRIGTTAALSNLIKYVTGGLAVRNAADSADAALTVSLLNVSGTDIVLNSDAAGSGADWTITLRVPSSGMGAAWVFTLPVDDGSPGQVLTTDGSGVTSWSSAGATNVIQVDDTPLAFGDSSPVAMFVKPAGSKVRRARVYVDTPFNGTAPTLSIGISGTVSKYGTTAQVDLKTAGVYEWDPGVDVVVGAETLIGTYSPDSSTAGAARIEIEYCIPS